MASNLPAEHVIQYGGAYCLLRSHGQVTARSEKTVTKVCCNCCLENNIRSVAFCCISTGEFHFPNKEAAEIAVNTTEAFLEKHGDAFDRVIFNVFKDMDLGVLVKIEF